MANRGADADFEAAVLEQESKTETPTKLAMEPVPGAPLPEGLTNPPCGEDGHFCLDKGGRYRPDFMQLRIHRGSKSQADPQYAQAGDEQYYVPLEKWVDVHPGIVNALRDAIETKYEQDYDENGMHTGEHAPITSRQIRRFSFETLKSA